MKMRVNAGFTLIELSIVILIIGLLAGGVMVGRDLIQTASARKTVGQIQEIQTVINAFKIKYNALPGDMPDAEEYWFNEGAFNGNGNGCIEMYKEVFGIAISDGFEAVNVWHHLAMAQLISGYFVPVDTLPTDRNAKGISYPVALNANAHIYCNEPYGSTASANLEEVGASYLTLYPSALTFYVSDFIGSALVESLTGITYGIWASDARYIDTKLDDGLPLTGNTFSATTSVAGNEPASCPMSDGSNFYNTNERATRPNCALWYKMPEINAFGK